MSDIDRLTIAVVFGFLLLIDRLPERQDFRAWSLPRLTFDILVKFGLTLGLIWPVLVIFGIWRA